VPARERSRICFEVTLLAPTVGIDDTPQKTVGRIVDRSGRCCAVTAAAAVVDGDGGAGNDIGPLALSRLGTTGRRRLSAGGCLGLYRSFLGIFSALVGVDQGGDSRRAVGGGRGGGRSRSRRLG